jgi:ubiquinol-cytochrome c reductase cytochrome b subunit
LQRPRNAATRTAFLAAMITVYGLLWAAGGNDILATHFHWSLNSITYFMRAAVFVIPPIVFYLTRRWCIGLQRADNDRLLHGYETGIIMRSAEGGYSERHLPISSDSAYTLTTRTRDPIHEIEADVDENGVAAPGSRVERVRARLSKGMFADNVQKPTAEELEEARHHAEHVHELEAGLDHPAAGHEFDDHALRDADETPLRHH